MQTKDDLDQYYSTKEDPWEYQSTADDYQRKHLIVTILRAFAELRNITFFDHALDLGAGEGWITAHLPAWRYDGYEISDVAALRFPSTVTRVTPETMRPSYDLVTTTGTLYQHYDWPTITQLIRQYATGIVLTCNIKQWEVGAAIEKIPGKQVFAAEFQYRQYVQMLRVFDLSK